MHLYSKIIFFLLFSCIIVAQSKTITGKVEDANSFPIESAAVLVYDSSNTIITYAVTNEVGIYSLNSVIFKSDYSIEIAHISFKKLYYKLTEEDMQKEELLLNFKLESNTAALDEVILVSSTKVKDTIPLDLDRLNLNENDNLKNILDKIPNFRVGNDGSIIYKGKNIDKILVNNKPSFDNQNSIALESIEKKIIDGISVINNYNDDFVLDFEENQESVLNINTVNTNEYILSGTVEGKYGYQNKYEIKAKEFLFSDHLNAFLMHNTNNIGKTIIQAREIKNLFNVGQPFSKYQAEGLGKLFTSNENLKKDFFTTTNLTLRNQTNRLKMAGLFYHIAPSRINSIIQKTSTIDKEPLLNLSDLTKSNSQSFLGTLFLAYKLTNKTIGTYKVNVNYMDNTNTSTIENEIFDNGSIFQTNTTFSKNRNNILSSFNDFSIKSKLKDNLIFESKLAFYNEKTDLLNDYNFEANNGFQSDFQNFKFHKNELQTNFGLKYKISNEFIPNFTFDYSTTNERINDKESDIKLINRSIDSYTSNLQIKGENIYKRLDYELSVGVNPFFTKLNSITIDKEIFIPVTIDLDYESPLHRYNLNYVRYKAFNSLESGIVTIQPFNTIWNGNTDFALGFNTTNTLKVQYNYDNFFDAKLFSISASYSNQKDILKKNFIDQQNGISTYNLFIANETNSIEFASFYSKTILQIKYPTKIDFGAKYKKERYPIIIGQEQVTIRNTNFSPEIKAETITKHLFNFSFTSKISFINDEVLNNKYKATYRQNSFSVLFKDDYWRGSVNFLLDQNTINGIDYSRRNINLDVSYTAKKFTYSLEARHIGELLNIFQNEAYNSQFVLKEGIASTIINNQSLNYIIFGIKYKL